MTTRAWLTQERADRVFSSGAPTDPEVRELRAHFTPQAMAIGMVIPKQDIAKIIGHDPETSRFATVVDRWRRLLEVEDDIIIGPVRGIGYKVFSPSERLGLC